MHVFQFRIIIIIITDAVVVVVVVVMMMLERFAALTVFCWRNHNVSSPRCGLLHSQGRLHRATRCTLGAALRPSPSREHYPRRAATLSERDRARARAKARARRRGATGGDEGRREATGGDGGQVVRANHLSHIVFRSSYRPTCLAQLQP